MPKYVLTGTDGALGRVAASHALTLAAPTDELIFTSHNLSLIPPTLARSWQDAGATLMHLDYSAPQADLEAVFANATAVSLISTWLIGEGRRAQHANVIAACAAAKVGRICYTSFVGAGDADASTLFLPRDHAWTEARIRGSGVPFCVQRNYLYVDNIASFFAPSWGFCGGRWLCNDGGKKGAFVAREDCGRVLGALVMGRGEVNTVYEVSGPEAVGCEEVFGWIKGRTGWEGRFERVSDGELEKWWRERGLPEEVGGDFGDLPCKLCVGDLVCCGQMVGRMGVVTDAVERLTGRKPLGFREVLEGYMDFFPKPEEGGVKGGAE